MFQIQTIKYIFKNGQEKGKIKGKKEDGPSNIETMTNGTKMGQKRLKESKKLGAKTWAHGNASGPQIKSLECNLSCRHRGKNLLFSSESFFSLFRFSFLVKLGFMILFQIIQWVIC